MNPLEKSDVLFQTTDVLGRQISTTKQYWDKIMLIKHRELNTNIQEAIDVLENPDEVRESNQDAHISLFYKMINQKQMVIVVKYIGNRGFIVTMYRTSKQKQKGDLLWQKQ
ncbi:MAG: hypothetical protein O3B87_05655 [bacterium]|nr:hypothetical protein [bacterium]